MRGKHIGNSYPLGAAIEPDGVNFCVFSPHARRVELVLFDDPEGDPARVIPLDHMVHRTGHYWHVFVPDIGDGQLYGYRADGPASRRFDASKLLLDPYALGVYVPQGYDRKAGARPGDNARVAMKSMVVDSSDYDWNGDHPLHRPFAETVIYELHVGGFTKHPSSGVPAEHRGTYRGLVEKIPYLKDLGITAVELLPVFQFDEQHGMKGLPNYWGYSPVSFFGLHTGYACSRDPRAAMREFRDMVKALHAAGIEVILDVVYNHTAEDGAHGPTQCFRGLADKAYYTLDAKGGYRNYTGTGNTVDASNSVVRRLILDSLAFWVREMHVDGFRFDLASILTRGPGGEPASHAPILWAIDSEPALAGTKLIAEAWDAGGLYQVGQFVGDRFTEWNGVFRDDVRKFLRAEPGMVPKLASRLLGSPDIYGHKRREPTQSINFVTCHDGFTLNDLVSYDVKHNEANREGSRDGADANFSWNCGVEGPTSDPEINALRSRQVRNFHAINLLALGTPMLLMGDEMRRTQGGNNNAWCQDNEVSWLDWRLLDEHRDLHRFVKQVLAFRRRRDISSLHHGVDLNAVLESATVHWHGTELLKPDWSPASRSLAMEVHSLTDRYRMHVMINALWDPLTFEVPEAPASPYTPWYRLIDTALPPPDDIVALEDLPGREPHLTPTYDVASRSVVLLLSVRPEMLAGE